MYIVIRAGRACWLKPVSTVLPKGGRVENAAQGWEGGEGLPKGGRVKVAELGWRADSVS